MEEIEVPTEHLQEEIHHAAQHERNRLTNWIAFSSAVIAALAAVTALLAGRHANEAVLEQIHASDSWNFFQAKGIKAAILSQKLQPTEEDQHKLAEYKKEQEEIRSEAEHLQKESRLHLEVNETLASGVTFFQVAISVAAISALTRKRRFWFTSSDAAIALS